MEYEPVTGREGKMKIIFKKTFGLLKRVCSISLDSPRISLNKCEKDHYNERPSFYLFCPCIYVHSSI
jgi:hypothetical protein